MPNPSAPRPMRPVQRTSFDEQVLPIRDTTRGLPNAPAAKPGPPCASAGGNRARPEGEVAGGGQQADRLQPQGRLPHPDPAAAGSDGFRSCSRHASGAGQHYNEPADHEGVCRYVPHDPGTFKWAGMATLASREVGGGEMQAYGLGASPTNFYLNATQMENLLAKGNFAVYNDIYWQLLAYRSCGLRRDEACARRRRHQQ